MQYRREVDGLRALAVIPVILFHAGFDAFSGGYIGVDIFFVISGYLITSIIARELDAGKFSIARFYERRARRILPALFLVLAACLPFAWAWLLPEDMKDFSQSLASVVLFGSNVLFWMEADYFGTAAEMKPLLHTWSLSVEEQFYLFFPLLLLLVWRLRKRAAPALVALVAVASLGLAIWGSTHYPTATFFLLPTRAWELAIGCLVALWLRGGGGPKGGRWAEAGAVAGVVAIVASVHFYDHRTPFPGIAALAPTVGTALLLLYATPATWVGRLLGTRVLVGIGLVSYSAYLWHQPLFSFARHRSLGQLDLPLVAALIAATGLLAFLSWRYVETPFRDPARWNRRQIFTAALLASTIGLAIGLVGHLTGGYFFREQFKRDFATLEHRLRPNQGLDAACDKRFTLSPSCRTSDTPEVLVWGDSFAMHLVPGLRASRPGLEMIQMTVSLCAPVFGAAPVVERNPRAWSEGCIRSNAQVHDYLQNTPSIRYVVLSSPFGRLVSSKGQLLLADGRTVDADREGAALFRETLAEIRRLGKIPVVFSPTPVSGTDNGRCIARAVHFGREVSDCDFLPRQDQDVQLEVDALLKGVEDHTRVVWLQEGICRDGTCRVEIDGSFIYRDMSHLSHEGSALLGTKMRFYEQLTTAP